MAGLRVNLIAVGISRLSSERGSLDTYSERVVLLLFAGTRESPGKPILVTAIYREKEHAGSPNWQEDLIFSLIPFASAPGNYSIPALSEQVHSVKRPLPFIATDEFSKYPSPNPIITAVHGAN
jgi:hypothetical protein